MTRYFSRRIYYTTSSKTNIITIKEYAHKARFKKPTRRQRNGCRKVFPHSFLFIGWPLSLSGKYFLFIYRHFGRQKWSAWRGRTWRFLQVRPFSFMNTQTLIKRFLACNFRKLRRGKLRQWPPLEFFRDKAEKSPRLFDVLEKVCAPTEEYSEALDYNVLYGLCGSSLFILCMNCVRFVHGLVSKEDRCCGLVFIK